MLFSDVYACTFHPGKFTSWGRSGVKAAPMHNFEGFVVFVVTLHRCLFGAFLFLPPPADKASRLSPVKANGD